MSSRDNGQPSLLEYARFHGLAINHLHQDIVSLLPLDVLTCDEDATLPEFRLPDLGRLPPEPKFQLNSKAASLLASSIRSPPAPDWTDILPVSDHPQVKKLKLEQPLLRTDHEIDMKRIRHRKPTRIGAMNLVPIEVDEDRGEGFAWTQETIGLAAVWDKIASQEKLQTTREVLKALQDTLRPVYTTQMREEILAEGSNFTRHERLDPISPPLMPSTFDEEQYIPSSPALRMQVLSDAPDPDDERLDKLNEEISNQNRIATGDATSANGDEVDGLLNFAQHCPARPQIDMLEDQEQTRTKARQCLGLLKVEPPEMRSSTPPASPQTTSSDNVMSTFALQALLPRQMKCEDLGTDEIDQPFKDELFAQLAHEAAQAVERDLATEKLEPADIIMRVEIPKLDAINPRTTTRQEDLKTMLQGHLEHTCRHFDKAEERKMKWTPIPNALVKSPMNESIDPPSAFNEWISAPALAIKSEDLLWRPEKLRVLSFDGDDEEETIEEAFFLPHEPAQESCLPLKRPLSDLTADLFNKQRRPQLEPEVEASTTGFGSLAGFMDTRKACKKPRLESGAKPSEIVPVGTPMINAPEAKPISEIQVPVTPSEDCSMDLTPLSVPRLPKVTSSRTIIVNSKLLNSHRQLTQALETRADPPLTINYRDLDTNSDPSAAPDIILSPTVAAIFTTLQATAQRSLPGQGASHPSIFNRVSQISQSYERLFLLVTLPATTEPSTSPLSSQATCSQISALTAFCASHYQQSPPTTVQPMLVPSPPPPNLTTTTTKTNLSPRADLNPLYTWTHALILQNTLDPTSCSSPALTLLPKETQWELFLRRAGMNPYGAQAVLGTLKKPDDHSAKKEQQQQSRKDRERGARRLWGLPALVQMRQEERLRIFVGVVGRREMDRLGAVLDVSWGGGGGGELVDGELRGAV